MKMYRQEKLLDKLLKFRFKKHGFDLIKVECYDRFDGDNFMCRLEVFKGGTSIEHRVMKHEGQLTESFVTDAEEKLKGIPTIECK
ncbi:hypothetical protein [Zobellia laminariae]